MATASGNLPAKLPSWVVDLVLVGVGAVLIVFGTVQGGRFGDGMTVGSGALALGAGLRGLMEAA